MGAACLKGSVMNRVSFEKVDVTFFDPNKLTTRFCTKSAKGDVQGLVWESQRGCTTRVSPVVREGLF